MTKSKKKQQSKKPPATVSTDEKSAAAKETVNNSKKVQKPPAPRRRRLRLKHEPLDVHLSSCTGTVSKLGAEEAPGVEDVNAGVLDEPSYLATESKETCKYVITRDMCVTNSEYNRAVKTQTELPRQAIHTTEYGRPAQYEYEETLLLDKRGSLVNINEVKVTVKNVSKSPVTVQITAPLTKDISPTATMAFDGTAPKILEEGKSHTYSRNYKSGGAELQYKYRPTQRCKPTELKVSDDESYTVSTVSDVITHVLARLEDVDVQTGDVTKFDKAPVVEVMVTVVCFVDKKMSQRQQIFTRDTFADVASADTSLLFLIDSVHVLGNSIYYDQEPYIAVNAPNKLEVIKSDRNYQLGLSGSVWEPPMSYEHSSSGKYGDYMVKVHWSYQYRAEVPNTRCQAKMLCSGVVYYVYNVKEQSWKLCYEFNDEFLPVTDLEQDDNYSLTFPYCTFANLSGYMSSGQEVASYFDVSNSVTGPFQVVSIYNPQKGGKAVSRASQYKGFRELRRRHARNDIIKDIVTPVSGIVKLMGDFANMF